MKFSTERINEGLIVVLLFIVVITGIRYARGDVYFLPDNIQYALNIHPSTNILAINSQNAISIFAGKKVQEYSISWKTASMLLNVVLYLMIGPFLLFKGYKKAKEHENRSKPWYWFLGGVICIGALTIIPYEIMRIRVFQNNLDNMEISRTKDMMRAELVDVGFATAQYGILEAGIDQSFTIEDLNLRDLNYDYAVESIQGDTLVIISVSTPELKEEITMEVRPYSRKVLSWRNL
jgi:hypothetical protein